MQVPARFLAHSRGEVQRIVAYRVATSAQAELIRRSRTQALILATCATRFITHVSGLVEVGHFLRIVRLDEAPFVAGRVRLMHRFAGTLVTHGSQLVEIEVPTHLLPFLCLLPHVVEVAFEKVVVEAAE